MALVPVHLTSERSHAPVMMGSRTLGVFIPIQSQDIFPDSKSELSLRQIAVHHFCVPLQCVPSQSSTVVALSFDACSRCRLHGVFIHGVLEDLTGELSRGLQVTTRGQSELKPPLVRAHLLRPGRKVPLSCIFPGLSPDHNAQNS